MTWLEWRHSRNPFVLLMVLALALGLLYLRHLLPSTPTSFQTRELGPWPNYAGCTYYTSAYIRQAHVQSVCHVKLILAGRWLDWWLPLLATLIGALFGSRVNDGMAFLRLQPFSAGRLLTLRLGLALLALTLGIGLAALLVSLRGAAPYSWWSSAHIMGQFWLGSLLVWLRGVTVLLLAAGVAQLLPAALAALLTMVSSLALLGFDFDPYTLRLTLEYTPAHFIPGFNGYQGIELIQQFIRTHMADKAVILPGSGTWTLIIGLVLVLLAVVTALFARRRV